jgi:hypothetical protein
MKQHEWSGSLCPIDPDNFWIDDDTGERVNATTGERTPPPRCRSCGQQTCAKWCGAEEYA